VTNKNNLEIIVVRFNLARTTINDEAVFTVVE